MRIAALALILVVTGCGPLTTPKVDRLSEEEQKTVDESWNNMFTPPERLDRSLLLDVLIMHQMHQRGVDRLELRSEKKVCSGRVIMTIRFDRAEPAFDEFIISYVDNQGRELRRERYFPAEIDARIEYLFHHDWDPPETRPEESPEERAAREKAEARDREREARMNEIIAATQPADGAASQPAARTP